MVENKMIKKSPKWIRVDDIWKKSTSMLEEISASLDMGIDEAYKKYWNRIERVSKILDFEVPVFEVRKEDYSDISDMYQRLNDKGTKIKAAEIALASIVLKFPTIFKEKLSKIDEEFDDWGFDINFFLRCFVCISTGQSRYAPLKKHLSAIDKKDLIYDMKKMRNGLDAGFGILRSHFGINERNKQKFIPSDLAIVSLMMYMNKVDGRIDSAVELDRLKLWFFTASFFGRYTGPTETLLNEDLRELANDHTLDSWINSIAKDRGGLEVREFDGMSNANNRFALYYALNLNNALDWYTGTSIKDEAHLEMHHIFPKKILREAQIPYDRVNDIRNIALVSRKANRDINSKDPREYLQDFAHERIRSQFIPDDFESLTVKNYSSFLITRGNMIEKALNDHIWKLNSV